MIDPVVFNSLRRFRAGAYGAFGARRDALFELLDTATVAGAGAIAGALEPDGGSSAGVPARTQAELEVTWGRALRVWWAVAWRCLLFGGLAGGAVGCVIGFIVGFIGGSPGSDRGSPGSGRVSSSFAGSGKPARKRRWPTPGRLRAPIFG